jgi:hypothetical protein
MVKYITSGTYSFLNECILYIITLNLQQCLLKHISLLSSVRCNVVGWSALMQYTAASAHKHYAAKILSLDAR